MRANLAKRGQMRRRLRILRRRREAMLLDLGALVLEMHRHGRFLPDSLQRRAAEAVGTDAELRVLARSLDAGDGDPDLVAAGIAGNCERCGALHMIGASYCSQCGNELEGAGVLPRKAALGADPELAGGAPVPRRTVASVPAPTASVPSAGDDGSETDVLAPAAEDEDETEPQPETAGEAGPDEREEIGTNGGPVPPPISRRARAARVRQRLDEPARRTPPLPTGLLAGIGAGVLVIVLGVLVLSSGGDDEPERAADTPAERESEPPPPDEAPAQPGDRADRDSASTPAALEPVEAVTAEDYDPGGDDEEHGAEAPLAVDGDGSTVWPTEEYEAGTLQKDGVGLALAPARPVAARGLDLVTPTPGFDVTIYGAEGDTVPASIDSGWTQIASEQAVPRRTRIDLDAAGREFSHYLVWITTLPEDEGRVEVGEARLLR